MHKEMNLKLLVVSKYSLTRLAGLLMFEVA